MKLAIFVRKDLDMRAGKIGAQCGHASVLAYIVSENPLCHKHLGDLSSKWLKEGQKKIVLKVPDERTLEYIENFSNHCNIQTNRVIDFGLTQIAPNTWTCLAVGPDEDEKIDEITKGYSLL